MAKLYINGQEVLEDIYMLGSWKGVGAAVLASGPINGNTLVFKANDTTFITLTTGATDVCTLAGITMSGTWLASGTVTIPPVTLGGTLTLNSQIFNAGAADAEIDTTGAEKGLLIKNTQDTATGAWLRTKHISASPAVDDIIFRHDAIGKDSVGNEESYAYFDIIIASPTSADEAGKLKWYVKYAAGMNEAMSLSGPGALWADLSVDTLTYKVSGSQVVGARVIDARCDDAIASGDATTDGVIDSLRDAMITHGLIAAA